ncbi:MFS transporter [Saccharopolyspora sp. CA-218241]|uniref:MFS transporter n=1 Tax=Saccharopolyspora sp. CA-218241 TaxID=3240027 RepID=UPI003D980343
MTTPARRLPRALLPFRHRAYRRLAVSLFFSLFTSGLWAVAQVWEVIRIGGGPPELSAVGAAASAGTLVFGLVGGVLADRLPQKHILLGVHGVQAACFGAAAVLSLTGQTRLWHLVVIGFVGGMASAFYYPAYSAWIPALVAADDLMAVNGFEGALRPTVQQAAGPAVAGLIIGALSPGIALAAASCCALLATGILTTVPATPLRGARGTAPRSAVADLLEGFRYVVSTRWLLSSLLFAALLVLAVMGPLQVLLPFFIKDHLGGDASAHAGMMAAFGIGGAAGSAVMTSLRIPRRYLTATLGMWGLSCTSFALIAVSDRLLTVAIAAFVLGALFSAPMVIWGRCSNGSCHRTCSAGCRAWTSSSRSPSCRCPWPSPDRSPR